MYQATYSEPLASKVSITAHKNWYTVSIYRNERKETRPGHEEGTEEVVYTYDQQFFHFNKGTFDTQDIVDNPEKYYKFTGDVEKVKAKLIDAVQNYMDKEAQKRGYDSIMSVITYADEPSVPRYQQEGLAARAWRSQVWNKGLSILNEVLTTDRAIPTVDELLAELPTITWPF